jgi:rod shape-determining protein MreC
MPLGTIERKAPPFFRHGISSVAQLSLYTCIALVMMVADLQFHVATPLRQALAVVMTPLQWVMLQPVEWARGGAHYFETIDEAQSQVQALRQQAVGLAQRAALGDYLQSENERLRALLDLRGRTATKSQAGEVLFDTADPYTRRVVIDRGFSSGVIQGSPVLDAAGVLGQVTQVHALTSEVTLLVDRDQAIPILNVRTGARGVAYGDPVSNYGGGMELRYLPVNADVQEGDELTTSGVDGVYPPGVPVARVVMVERPADSAFAKVYCAPIAQILGPRHVVILDPIVNALSEVPQKGIESQAQPLTQGSGAASARQPDQNPTKKP